MARIVDGNLILESNEIIKFPNTQISDTGSLEISTGIDVTQLKGVRVDMTTLVDEGILTYDSTSDMLIFSVLTPPAPPAGPTRGVWGGGFVNFGNTTYDIMDYVTIASTSNAANFGVLTIDRSEPGATSNGTNDRGIWGGGFQWNGLESPDEDWYSVDRIDYHTISSTGNAIDFGNMTTELDGTMATSNDTNERAVWGGGRHYLDGPGDEDPVDDTSYRTINSLGNATNFGTLTFGRRSCYGTSNGTNERALFGPGGLSVAVDYLTINTLSASAHFGDITELCLAWYPYNHSRGNASATSNATNERAVWAGGYNYCLTIDYMTINSLGDSTYFGDLTYTDPPNQYGRGYMGATSSGVSERGVFGGGEYYTGPALNIIDYITINSAGNATDFGDLTVARYGSGACSG